MANPAVYAQPIKAISDAIRPVFFQTDYPEFPHATHGGTVFLVRFAGRAYGLTCKHVFGDFDPDRLFITPTLPMKKRTTNARIVNIAYASSFGGAFEGSDIGDICVLEFAEDIETGFFHPSEYIIDRHTIGSSETGHDLLVCGFSKERSRLLREDANFSVCTLHFETRARKAIHCFVTPVQNMKQLNSKASPVLAALLCTTLRPTRCVAWFFEVVYMVKSAETVW